uniref:Ubiquitin-activating enzyme E1 C-terminal domain-containing protein n=1 Tax=viral metagenome TaxID=1070528 RepID=A0A6C0EK37_9ZZZZ
MDIKKENLYSRQIGTIGADTMLKLANLKVLVYGLDNIGLEVCKCLCLLGIKTLYIYDPLKISKKTLGYNFIINKIPETPKNIDTYCLDYLKELNSYVQIELVKPNFTEEFHTPIIKDVDMVILTHLTISPTLLNKMCRENNTKFMLGLCYGFSGYIFTDFVKHTIQDFSGEAVRKTFITKVETIETFGTVLHVSDNTVFNTGDIIKFCGVSEACFTISKCVKGTLYIQGVNNLHLDKVVNLEIIEVKEVQEKMYKPLSLVVEDEKYPSNVLNITDYDKTIKLLKDFHRVVKSDAKLNDDSFKYIVSYEYKFPIIQSILGSILAQEVLKVTGKYCPIEQELLIDYSELSRPNDSKTLYKSVPNDNYTDVYKLLTKDMIKYLKNLNIFLVGSGALGCEYLKLFHMLNISSNKHNKHTGCVTLTDMDTIELSNLNRQFLFRSEDIGSFKSKVAKDKINEFNKLLRVTALDKQVGEETEAHFDRRFWSKQDIVVNALDNVKARQYVDSKCILHNKPLFETGTLGVKANVQVIVPHKTCSYSDTVDPPEKEIPVCTLKNFPFKIEHCIQWGLDTFNDYFNESMIDLMEYKGGKANFKHYLSRIDNDNIKNEKLVNMERLLIALKDELIYEYIVQVFTDLFITPIEKLVIDNPKDKLNEDGTSFWTGIRRYPQPIKLSNPILLEFIQHYGTLMHKCLNKPSFVLKSDYSPKLLLGGGEGEGKEGKDAVSIPTSTLIEQVYAIELDIGDITPQPLEKDDDSNGHIQFIKTISNIRGCIYNMEPTDFINCKLVAGRITPALSTTTTLVTALSMMEILKYVYNKVYSGSTYRELNYKDSFINTGINMYVQSEPNKPIKIQDGIYSSVYGSIIKTIPESFTTWDSIKLSRKEMGIVNIRDLLEFLKDKFTIDINMISCGDSILYSKYSDNTNSNIAEIYQKFGLNCSELIEISISSLNANGVPIVIPRVIYSLSD